MANTMNRREFTTAMTMGLGTVARAGLQAQTPTRRLKIGHTGITWGFAPRDAEQAIKDVASLGYHGYESFGERARKRGRPPAASTNCSPSAKLPLRSAYCPVNLTDATKRKDEVAKLVRWAQLDQEVRRLGGRARPERRASGRPTTFADHKANIVTTLNEMGKALDGTGVTGVLHQHTGTCVESRDETYAVMEAVDTRYVKFGPDVGQLQKGGSDPVQVVQGLSIRSIQHVHLKDFNGRRGLSRLLPDRTGQSQRAGARRPPRRVRRTTS